MKLTKPLIIENYIIHEGTKLEEELSLELIRQKYFYTGNNNPHLNFFYNQRKDLMGQPNTQIKLTQTKFLYDPEGAVDFYFLTEATIEAPDEKNKKYQVLKDGPIQETNATGELVDNPSKIYTEVLRIKDFYTLLEELDLVDSNDFTKANLKAILELSQAIYLSCDCPSQWWMGASYHLHSDGASLLKCTIPPIKRWNKIRPSVKVCKHLSTLLHPQTISFLLPQMAQAVKKVLIDEGFIKAKK